MMTVSARTVYYSTSRDVQIYTRSGHLRKYSNTLFFIDKIKTCASHMTPGIISADWRMNGFSIQFAAYQWQVRLELMEGRYVSIPSLHLFPASPANTLLTSELYRYAQRT